MSKNPYDYSTRQGILPISWEDFHGICKAIAMAVSRYQPEIILPVGRGGYYPGSLIAHMLQIEPFPVRLSRRINDLVVHDLPRWLVEPPALIRERRVLIVDEICGSGETLSMVKEKAVALGATAVKSAVLYAHTWGIAVPNYIGIVTDALVLNPWDREVLQGNEFVFHPEYFNALMQQGLKLAPGLLIPATPFRLDKTE